MKELPLKGASKENCLPGIPMVINNSVIVYIQLSKMGTLANMYMYMMSYIGQASLMISSVGQPCLVVS